MARTLSDTIIVAMVEAATRLTSGRGPISTRSADGAGGPNGVTLPTGAQGGAAPPAPPVPATVEGTGATPAASAAGGASNAAAEVPPREYDHRTAEQIAADFKTIYKQIEEVVKESAEQETKSVGFAVR